MLTVHSHHGSTYSRLLFFSDLMDIDFIYFVILIPTLWTTAFPWYQLSSYSTVLSFVAVQRIALYGLWFRGFHYMDFGSNFRGFHYTDYGSEEFVKYGLRFR